MSPSICSQNNTNRSALFHLATKNCGIIPKVITVIVALGSLFLLLASYRVLPSLPNAVSDLGVWGKALGFCAMTICGISFVILYLKTKHRMTISSPRIRQQNSLHNQQTKKLESDLQADIQALGAGPKRKRDGKEVDLAYTFEYMQKASNFFIDLDQAEDILLTDDQIKLTLSDFIRKFVDLYDNGRFAIPEIAPSALFAQVRTDSTAIPKQLNQKIDEVKVQLAVRLAHAYPTSEDPPKELRPHLTERSEALQQLKTEWIAQRERNTAQQPPTKVD